MLKNHIMECKKNIGESVEMINDPFFGANFKVVSECKQKIVCAQVEINRAEFNYNEYACHDLRKNPEDLPDREGLIIVYLTGYAHNCMYDDGVDMVYWCNDGKFFEDAAMNQLVRGWRHIPKRWE